MVRVLVIGLVLGSALCQAEAYWVEYDPSSGLFPEECGWLRLAMGGGAQRSFEDGALVLDGLASRDIVDCYGIQQADGIDPGPGELFVVQWRLRVDTVIGACDPAISVAADDSRWVQLSFSESTVRSLEELSVSAEFEAGVYHDYEFRSADMRSYQLLIDGGVCLSGSFVQGLTPSAIGWGDKWHGDASLSRWQYVRFGTIPEPRTASMVTLALAMLVVTRAVDRAV
jgi:hypothetical protein